MNEQALREIAGELGLDVLGRNSGNWLVARCPFAPLGYHSKGYDGNPSFNIKINHSGVSGFNCFTCGQSGTMGGLVDRLAHLTGDDYGNLAHRSRLKELSVSFNDFGVSFDELPPEPLDSALFAGIYPFAWEDPDALNYIQSRGIPMSAAIEAGALFDPEGRRIIFPVKDYDGNLYGYTGRSIIPDEERRLAKIKDYHGLKKKWHLLGEELIRSNEEIRPGLPLVVVEGLFAYLSLIARGARDFCNPVATMGAHMSDQQRDRIAYHGRPVVMLYDDDVAGDVGLYGKQNDEGEHNGQGALSVLSPHVPTHLGLYPPGVHDPDTLTTEQIRHIVEKDKLLFPF